MVSAPLAPLVTRAGLSHRTDAELNRERHQFGSTVANLFNKGKGGLDRGAPDVTVEDISSGLDSDQLRVATAAAWLAGRVARPGADAVPSELARRLPDFVEAFAPDDIGPKGPPYVEALMSMVLAGERDAAAPLLVDVVEHVDWVNTHRFLAAYYLAQMGDPRGWPVMLADLGDDEPHTRLMAARHLLAFRPFDGSDVGGERVDVGAQLRTALRDKDPYVAVEVPALMLEAEIADVEGDLRHATKRPFPRDVREAAKHALQHVSTA